MAIPQQRDPEVTRKQLIGWLHDQRPGAIDVDISGLEIPRSGFSNETFYFDASWREARDEHRERLVARVQPEGHQLFLNPDVFLQSAMMKAVASNSDVPVPSVFAEERDAGVIGAPFYVMRRVDGRVATEVPSYHQEGWVADLSPAERERFYGNALAAFAGVPQLDWRDGFQFLAEGGPEPGLDRYLQWVKDWYDWAAGGRPMGIIEDGMRYVLDNRPTDPSVTVVWGDSRPGNMMIADDLSVAAVIDWEMAALGPPEIDLGWWLFFERFLTEGNGLPCLEGIPGRDATIAEYESLTESKVRDIEYYEILGALRMAITSTRFLTRLAAAVGFDYDDSIHTTNGVVGVLARYMDLPVPETSPSYFQLLTSLSH